MTLVSFERYRDQSRRGFRESTREDYRRMTSGLEMTIGQIFPG